MMRALATLVALAICMSTLPAAAQDDDMLDDPEAGLTGEDDGDEESEGEEADEGAAAEDEAPPDVEGEVELDGDGPLIAIGSIQLGGALGYDVSLESGDIDPFGLALTLSAGVVLESKIYVGLFLDYHLGESDSGQYDRMLDFGGTETVKWEVDWAFHHYGLAVGYDMDVADSIVGRPLAVLGVQTATVNSVEGGQERSGTEHDLLFGLGGKLLYLGDGFYVGPELRWNVSLGDPAINSLSMQLAGGVTL